MSDLLLPWLQLGEAVYALSFKKNPGRIYSSYTNGKNRSVKQLVELAGKRLIELTDTVYKDDRCELLRSMLRVGDDRDKEAPKFICISLLIWMRLGAVHPDTSVNMVAQALSDSLTGTKPENLLEARRTIFGLVNDGLLVIRDGNVFLFGSYIQILCGSDRLTNKALTKPDHDDMGTSTSGDSTGRGTKRGNEESAFKDYIKKLEVPRPMELDAMIDGTGYVGQEQARRAICLSAYLHCKRVKAIHIDGKDPNSLPKRDCLLFIGETGSGKTHLCETVFDRLLKIPTVIFNSANLTEAGYVGSKVEHLLVKLYSASGNNTLISQTGVIVLDEICKVASTNSGVMPGERVNRDINGESVQKVLLKLLEGGQLSVPNVGSGCSAWDFNARDTLVIGSGAFSALHNQKNLPSKIGFGSTVANQPHRSNIGREELARFGFCDEFTGRWGKIVCFDRLGRVELKEILERTVLNRFSNELKEMAVEFSVAPKVIDLLVDRAIGQKLGARGLTNGLSEVMQDALYELYSVAGVKDLRLVSNGDNIGYEVTMKNRKSASNSVETIPPTLRRSSATSLLAV